VIEKPDLSGYFEQYSVTVLAALFTDWVSFPASNQQHQTTEGNGVQKQ